MVKRYKEKQLSVVIMLLRIELYFSYLEVIYLKNTARVFRIMNCVYCGLLQINFHYVHVDMRSCFPIQNTKYDSM